MNATAWSIRPTVRIVSVAQLPTRFGAFQVVAFRNDHDPHDHVALVRGELLGAHDVPVRLHSECLTGDVLGSLRCDCRDQLLTSLEILGQRDRGMLLYMRQEGRGIGLANKLAAYALQDTGLDTVEANQALGFADDERDYTVAAGMIAAFGVASIQLITNNPDKIGQLEHHGVEVTGRIPLITPTNPHNAHYLETKRARSGHLLPARGAR